MNKQQIENILSNHAHQIERYDLSYNDTQISIVKKDDGTGSNKIVLWAFSRWWELPEKTLDTSLVGLNAGVVGGYSSGDQVYAFFNETETRFLGYGLLPFGGDPTLVSIKYKRLYRQNKEHYTIRNYFINGNLEIWQRGTSFAAFGGGNYCADRIRSSGTGSYAITASQSTDVPSNSLYNFLNYSLKIDCTTAEAAVAASEYAMIDHRIEGINVVNLKNRPCILSFWVKSTKTGTMGVSIYNTSSWVYLTTITINQASTWERKIVKFYIDTSSGTWNYDNSMAIDLRFCLMCGSNYQSSSTEQWTTANYLSNANQTNFLDSAANDIYFAGFQLIEGGHDLVCKPLSMEAQVEQCQRYYEKSYNLTTDPGTVTNVGATQTRTAAATRHLSSLQRVFMTRKRDTPTVDWYSPNSGTVSRIYDASGTSDYTLSSDARAGEASTGYPNVTIAIPDGSLIMGHWTADAEL